MKPPPENPTSEEYIEAFKEILRLYGENRLPPEGRKLFEEFLNDFKSPN
jgi:hypothetical protein